MKIIVQYIREYVRHEWNVRLFGGTAVVLMFSFGINYGFDFETNVMRRLTSPWEEAAFFYFFYAVPYFITLMLWSAVHRRWEVMREVRFWFLFHFCFMLLAVYVVLHNVPFALVRSHPDMLSFVPIELHTYVARYASNVVPGVAVLGPVAAYWYAYDRRETRLYGFSTSNICMRTYAFILLMLVPIVFAASFSPDFREAYPRYVFGLPASLAPGERTAWATVFQFCYGVDFVFVEFLFRGFMVMAFARFLGSAAILPMVVVYAFIHFQKPIGEAAGSIVGGLILGIISYNTRSIYGGVMLHLGVAYLMELAGSIQMWMAR